MGRGRGVVEVVGDGGHGAHEGEDRHREGQQSVGSVPKRMHFCFPLLFSWEFWVLGFSLCFCFAASASAGSWVRPGEQKGNWKEGCAIGRFSILPFMSMKRWCVQ